MTRHVATFVLLAILMLLIGPGLIAPAQAAHYPSSIESSLSSGPAAQAEPSGGDSPTSADAPTGYTPGRITVPDRQPAGADADDILLIQTSLPWDVNTNTIVLDDLGYGYDIVDMTNLNSVNLFSYQVILIVNDQVQAFYDAYANRVSAFETYVRAGGVLLFFAASDGWADGTLRANLPGGVAVTTPHYEYWNYVVTATHPIVTGELSANSPVVNADLYNYYCSHGYFTSLPAGTVTVFRDQHNHPTLIDYQLGAGRVIASTNTWEHAYWYQSRVFARKALDDVFLYALSGGGSVVRDLSVDVHVEDAPDEVGVRKSRGSFVDIVAELNGSQTYHPTVTLAVNGNELGSPIKTFTRNRADDSGYGQENAYVNLGDGRYRVETTLVGMHLDNRSTFHKEVVWRFKVPDDADYGSLGFAVTVAQQGAIIINGDDSGAFQITDTGNALLVTNRSRLFAVHGQGGEWDSARDLLQEVYRAAAQQTGEVFYVERYGISWNSTTDETAANNTVQSIDDKLEEWYDELKGGFLGLAQQPEYLVLVGGDEVIPFYRADDDDYGSCSVDDCEDDHWAKGNAGNGVLWDVYADNYFLTDNIYADIGGDKRNWENGDLELAIGRIAGADAGSMRSLIRNGYNVGEALSSAGLSSVGGLSVGDIDDALADEGVTIHGQSNPDITENNAWRAADFVQVWQRDWQVFLFGSHADPNTWATGEKKNYAMESIPWADLDNPNIAANRSLLFSTGCNFAVPLANGLTHFMIDQSFSGVIGSSGVSYYNESSWFELGGEKLANEYAKILMKPDTHTSPFGEALREAKRNFDPGNGTDRKTMLEYVYYGLPWAHVSYGDANRQRAQVVAPTPGYAVALSTPRPAGVDSYQLQIAASVDSYLQTELEGYDLLVIDGADSLTDGVSPALPYIVQTIFLPPGSTVSGLSLMSETTTNLGVQSLPTLEPITTYDETSGVLPFTGTGIYPSPQRWAYQVVDFPEYTAVEVLIYLAAYNGATDVLTLFNNTQLALDYTTTASAVIRSLQVGQPSYVVGQSVAALAEIQNVTGAAVQYSALLTVFDAAEAVVAEVPVAPFTIAAGATYPLSVSGIGMGAAGPYQVVFTLFEGATPVVAAQESFTAVDGAVTGFAAPDSVMQGSYADITLTYRNLRPQSIYVEAEILILDGGVEVGNLFRRTFLVAANSQGTTTWAWDPAAFPPGTYTLRPVVTVNGVAYPAADAPIEVEAFVREFFIPVIRR